MTKRRASRFSPPAFRILLLAFLLLAAGLRFYRLDAQSFWNDEGNSARIAERSLDLIVEGAAGDIHPPGYYLLLHCWRALFGQSEFALRSLSAVAGLALVALTYLLGHALFDEVTGTMAAFLAVISPFAIYYSQEARMYMLLSVLSAASTYLFLHALTGVRRPASRDPRSGVIVAYILISVAGLYTHYAFPFVLLTHNVTFGLWWLVAARCSAHRWRWLGLWAVVQVVVVVLYLPWLPAALRSVTGWPAADQPYELGPALLNVLRMLSVGATLKVERATAALVSAGLLLLIGLWPAQSVTKEDPADNVHIASLMTGRVRPVRETACRSWFHVASVGLYLFVPIALIFTFDLYKPAWLKFLVVVLPPFHILVAHGFETRFSLPTPRFLLPTARCLLLGLYLIATFSSLYNLYFDPAYARDDYRQIAADVAAIARSGDAVILNAPNQWEVFTYYYPNQDVYPAPYHPGRGKVESFLAPLVEWYRRLFVLYWGDAESDPERLIETWLANHAYKTGDRWYGRVRLAAYGVASLPEEPTVALEACFGETIRLSGYALADGRLAPGDILPVTLFWQSQKAIAERYKVTVQLLDERGELAAQHDAEPGAELAPTTAWRPGQLVVDRHGVSLPADLPPGPYMLIVGLYHIGTGERLPVTLDGHPLGDHLLLDTEINVVRGIGQ
jgi:4-amino-4-deoxy-L-arabinose transferase-like glycosyltransferase